MLCQLKHLHYLCIVKDKEFIYLFIKVRDNKGKQINWNNQMKYKLFSLMVKMGVATLKHIWGCDQPHEALIP